MTTDFDQEIDIRNCHSAKWDMAAAATGAEGEDIIPMWVADMDFRPPQAVTDVLQGELDRGILGYYGDDSTLRSAIVDWYARRHDWVVRPEWISFSHGVVAGLGIVLEAFTQKGDGVILFTPVYHAFARKVEAKGRKVVESLLTLNDGRFEMDLDALAASLTGDERMVIFCSPHNPGGTLWRADEIEALAAFCDTHDLILVSDEIHMDLTFPGAKHLVTATVAPAVAPRLVTLSSAAKTFNLAGGETSFIIVGDPDLRRQLAAASASFGGSPNRFGMLMMEAAFTEGHDWLAAVQDYIAENFRIFRDGVNAIPGLSVMDMQSTYLVWVDFSGTGMEREEFSNRVLKGARIAANHGPSFGTGGEACMRFNVATRRALVEDAVARLGAAFSDLQ